MKKFLAVFATLLFCQLGHAIPVIPGAVDLATTDGETYYALVAKDGAWYIDGYTHTGTATGYSVALTPGGSVTTSAQHFVGLAFDGTSFTLLRNDLTGAKGTDTWSLVDFGTNGSFVGGSRRILSPTNNVIPSLQTYVALGWADGDIAAGAFYGLRNNDASPNVKTGWSIIGFSDNGSFNGYSQSTPGDPSGIDYMGMAVYATSPNTYETTTNTEDVPGPASGLVLSTLLLGLFARRMMAQGA
ncbi:MAG: hypothetical protein QF921_12620 [Pseudomonadales bacterium]|jgi:hypothetical protein|nr:hypothetical protein [Pseudomonadales bacterium]|tara:strand:+ start:759 stop:1487 length:729 start_codon:yes stop_codon:yes gene_type:complete